MPIQFPQQDPSAQIKQAQQIQQAQQAPPTAKPTIAGKVLTVLRQAFKALGRSIKAAPSQFSRQAKSPSADQKLPGSRRATTAAGQRLQQGPKAAEARQQQQLEAAQRREQEVLEEFDRLSEEYSPPETAEDQELARLEHEAGLSEAVQKAPKGFQKHLEKGKAPAEEAELKVVHQVGKSNIEGNKEALKEIAKQPPQSGERIQAVVEFGEDYSFQIAFLKDKVENGSNEIKESAKGYIKELEGQLKEANRLAAEKPPPRPQAGYTGPTYTAPAYKPPNSRQAALSPGAQLISNTKEKISQFDQKLAQIKAIPKGEYRREAIRFPLNAEINRARINLVHQLRNPKLTTEEKQILGEFKKKLDAQFNENTGL